MVKGCGLMRVWKVERNGRLGSISPSSSRSTCGCGYYQADESTVESPEVSSLGPLRSSASYDFVTTPFSNWATILKKIGEQDLTEMLALEHAVHLLPKGSTMSIILRPLFRFRNSDLETAYKCWCEHITKRSYRFFLAFFGFYLTVVVSAGTSLANFQLEPVASSVEWKIFSIVYYIFISALPIALVGALYITIKAPRSVRTKYMWVSELSPECNHWGTALDRVRLHFIRK